MSKSLLRSEDLQELKERIFELSEASERKWGRMNAAQMLCHCNKILEVSAGKIILPKINFFLRIIGVTAKFEMKIFLNGIPPNMPTFKKLIVKENCNFEESRKQLLKNLDEFVLLSNTGKLPKKHELFGKMTKKDWGFLEYKHLNHHLKQFGK